MFQSSTARSNACVKLNALNSMVTAQVMLVILRVNTTSNHASATVSGQRTYLMLKLTASAITNGMTKFAASTTKRPRSKLMTQFRMSKTKL